MENPLGKNRRPTQRRPPKRRLFFNHAATPERHRCFSRLDDLDGKSFESKTLGRCSILFCPSVSSTTDLPCIRDNCRLCIEAIADRNNRCRLSSSCVKVQRLKHYSERTHRERSIRDCPTPPKSLFADTQPPINHLL